MASFGIAFLSRYALGKSDEVAILVDLPDEKNRTRIFQRIFWATLISVPDWERDAEFFEGYPSQDI